MVTVDIKAKEEAAQRLLAEHAYQEAAEVFAEVGQMYREVGEHQTSAMCIASAASCWTLHLGEKTYYHAAKLYKTAAQEAEEAHNLEYAALMYRHAAICYERDLEYLGFSECFYLSKEFYRRYLCRSLFVPGKDYYAKEKTRRPDSHFTFPHLLQWLALTFSSWLWGHGERPFRTVLFAAMVILGCALLYMQGFVMKAGGVGQLNFLEAVYFSVVTFTTVGYGDIVPLGVNRSIVIAEAFGGLFIAPLFLTGLCRKYLRF
jgi:hypothetical protein